MGLPTTQDRVMAPGAGGSPRQPWWPTILAVVVTALLVGGGGGTWLLLGRADAAGRATITRVGDACPLVPGELLARVVPKPAAAVRAKSGSGDSAKTVCAWKAQTQPQVPDQKVRNLSVEITVRQDDRATMGSAKEKTFYAGRRQRNERLLNTTSGSAVFGKVIAAEGVGDEAYTLYNKNEKGAFPRGGAFLMARFQNVDVLISLDGMDIPSESRTPTLDARPLDEQTARRTVTDLGRRVVQGLAACGGRCR